VAKRTFEGQGTSDIWGTLWRKWHWIWRGFQSTGISLQEAF